MNASDADRQIKQMVNFILQEAQEKANEIRVKTEHDFNLEKQMLVHNAKLKIQEEYSRMEKEREINKRIARSLEIAASRKTKMIAREELLQELGTSSKNQCSNIRKDKIKYKDLLRDLTVQGLIKLHETSVMIRCREDDLALVESLLNEIKKNYIDILKKEANLDIVICSAGGVTLVALGGKIICDNTLDTRLAQVYYDLKPKIRNMLFPVLKAN